MSRTYSRETPLGQRMAALGYTVKEVAAESGVDRWMINDYLKGKPITPLQLMRLSAFLKCQPETIQN